MKFLVVGLGSMGRRRVRCLQHLKAGEVIGFDLRDDRRSESAEKYGIRTFSDFEEAMSQSPDALIISTPPDQQREYALAAARAGKHFFTECNCLPDGVDDLVEVEEQGRVVAAPSLTLPYHPAVKQVSKMLNEGLIGRVLAFSHRFGGYLPGWHPWRTTARLTSPGGKPAAAER